MDERKQSLIEGYKKLYGSQIAKVIAKSEEMIFKLSSKKEKIKKVDVEDVEQLMIKHQQQREENIKNLNEKLF